MKIAHLPFCYFPDPAGGTEIYVQQLAREQQKLGQDPFVVAPAAQRAQYRHDDLRVYRYAVDSDVDDIAELYSSDRSVDAAGFIDVLEKERPDVLHVHGYTHGVTRAMLSAAQQRGIRIVFTYHTPTATCGRGTLMLFGDTLCDGVLDARRCAACVLHSRGVPRLVANALSHAPLYPSKLVRHGRIAVGLRMRELMELRHAEIRNFLAHVDHIIAPARWVLELLLRIGVERERITLNRQGTQDIAAPPARTAQSAGPLRLVFLGRMDESKGLHLLIEAMADAPELDVRLDVYTIAQSEGAYGERIRKAAENDARISFEAPQPYQRIMTVLSDYDALIVPSQWLETGPLVVLEAFAAGLPVIGSRLGGIAELVRDDVDGVLVAASDVNAWRDTLQRLAEQPQILNRLRANVGRPRTMKQVAADMQQVYRAVLAAA